MPDAVLGADPVEQHSALDLARPNRPVKNFPIVSEDLIRIPCRRSAPSSASHTGPAVARRTSWADTPNRELSSMPDTAFNSVPSASESADHIHLPQVHRPAPIADSPAGAASAGPAPPARYAPAPDRCWSRPAPGRSRPSPAGNRSGLYPKPDASA
jgi:hypothetical protein